MTLENSYCNFCDDGITDNFVYIFVDEDEVHDNEYIRQDRHYLFYSIK